MVQGTKTLDTFVLIVMLGILLAAMLSGDVVQTFQGFFRLQVTPARLVSDFTAVEGVGPTLLNVAAVGCLGYLFLILNKLQVSGAGLAALFTMMGFSFFGKTLFNCIPIMLGVSLSALIVKKKPRDYALIAMFGTAMGPLITFIAFELGMRSIFALPGSFAIGIVVGLVMPPIAIVMLRLHQGYNLYNVGLSAGFLGLLRRRYPTPQAPIFCFLRCGARLSNPCSWRWFPQSRSLRSFASLPKTRGASAKASQRPSAIFGRSLQ